MFDQFSVRARRVVFLTRMKAGRRGAPALEPEHLVEALIIEDQGELAKAMGIPDNERVLLPVGDPALKPSRPFFPGEAASEVLQKLERALTKADPIPDQRDMPMSPALSRTFDAAIALRKQLGHKQAEPLHLLAAVLSESSSKASEILKDVGVTREAVIAALQSNAAG